MHLPGCGSLQQVEMRTGSSVTSGHWPGLNSSVTASSGGLHGGTPHGDVNPAVGRSKLGKVLWLKSLWRLSQSRCWELLPIQDEMVSMCSPSTGVTRMLLRGMVLHSSQAGSRGGDRVDTVPQSPAAGRKASSPVCQVALRQDIQVLAGGQVSSGISSRGEQNQAGGCSWELCSRAGSSATCPGKWLLPCPK